MAGIQGGWVLNRRFVIGGAARGIAPLPEVELQNVSPDAPTSARLQLGYLGLLLEYIGRPSNLLHYGTKLVVGGGSVELIEDSQFRAGVSASNDGFDWSGVFAATPFAQGKTDLHVAEGAARNPSAGAVGQSHLRPLRPAPPYVQQRAFCHCRVGGDVSVRGRAERGAVGHDDCALLG
jgi:hypothetical protein